MSTLFGNKLSTPLDMAFNSLQENLHKKHSNDTDRWDLKTCQQQIRESFGTQDSLVMYAKTIHETVNTLIKTGFLDPSICAHFSDAARDKAAHSKDTEDANKLCELFPHMAGLANPPLPFEIFQIDQQMSRAWQDAEQTIKEQFHE
jgi:hypothetical protein